MYFFVGLAAVLLLARIATHGKCEERPDTTGNTMQDAQLERALNTGADELDVSLNANLTAAQKQTLKDQLLRFKMENALAAMNSTSSQASRDMATQPGRVRSAYA
jgi:hypothetical protein